MKILLPFLILAMAAPVRTQPPAPLPERSVTDETATITSPRNAVMDVAKSTLGWREATGKNDGPQIDRILSTVGLQGSGAPYCAAFCVYSYEEAGVGSKIPHSAWSPDLVKSPTWLKGRGETPRPADVFGIFFASKGRVAHVGLVEKWGNGTAVTIEGNTSPQAASGSEADRDGEGIHRKWRLTSTIYAVRSFL